MLNKKEERSIQNDVINECFALFSQELGQITLVEPVLIITMLLFKA